MTEPRTLHDPKDPGKQSMTDWSEPIAAGDAGLDPEAVAELERSFAALVDEGRRAGVVWALGRGGRSVASGVHGWADLAAGLPMTPTTQFRVFSQSRVVTGVVALILIERGLLGMDDPVAGFVPEFADTPVVRRYDGDSVAEIEPQRTPMTVRHLSTYTSGLGYPYGTPAGLGMNPDRIVDLSATLADGMRELARSPLMFQPGQRWQYGYSGDLLAVVCEVAARRPFAELVRDLVLTPLGMTDTAFWAADPARLAVPHAHDAAGRLVDASAKITAGRRFTEPTPYQAGGSGLVSTVGDWMRFGQFLLDRGRSRSGVQVLSSAGVEAMLTRQTTAAQGDVMWYQQGIDRVHSGYGWGHSIAVRDRQGPHGLPGSPGDAGWGGFLDTTFFVDPAEDLVGVAMTQHLLGGPQLTGPTLRRGSYAALHRGHPSTPDRRTP